MGPLPDLNQSYEKVRDFLPTYYRTQPLISSKKCQVKLVSKGGDRRCRSWQPD